MDREFWIERWERREIGFHQATAHASLERYWASLGVPGDARVLVPLAGKSLDMAWLRARGHGIVGIELSEIAVREFFASQGLEPLVERAAPALSRWSAGGYELLCGDFFAVDAAVAGACAAVYDRAALVALPPDMRVRYAAKMDELCHPGTRMLLATLEYAQEMRNGPPFSVGADEVASLYGAGWSIELLDRSEPHDAARFKASGLPWIHEASWRLERRG
jgi:thiopurine S-methyltransferase